jgi:hypothetical protein
MGDEGRNLIVNDDDGFDVPENNSGGFIKGGILKFNNNVYTADKSEVLPIGTELVVIGVKTVWVKWGPEKPLDHRETLKGMSHPMRDELPDQDEGLWPPGLDDKPADPWRDTRYLYQIDPKTGANYTFITDTKGGHIAVGELKQQISTVRKAHPGAMPVVKLALGTMKTKKYGNKPRPKFEIIGWKGNGAARPSGDMDDAIPF